MKFIATIFQDGTEVGFSDASVVKLEKVSKAMTTHFSSYNSNFSVSIIDTTNELLKHFHPEQLIWNLPSQMIDDLLYFTITEYSHAFNHFSNMLNFINQHPIVSERIKENVDIFSLLLNFDAYICLRAGMKLTVELFLLEENNFQRMLTNIKAWMSQHSIGAEELGMARSSWWYVMFDNTSQLIGIDPSTPLSWLSQDSYINFLFTVLDQPELLNEYVDVAQPEQFEELPDAPPLPTLTSPATVGMFAQPGGKRPRPDDFDESDVALKKPKYEPNLS